MSASRQIVCGNCGRINRLPVDRPVTAARCGSCHQPLFSGRPIEVDETGFGRHVAHSDIPVLVDVWAPRCGPRRAMAPMYERAARELEPKVRLLILNADIPTLLLMQGGREIARTSGALDAKIHRRMDDGGACLVTMFFLAREGKYHEYR
jgi:thioredoxin 2